MFDPPPGLEDAIPLPQLDPADARDCLCNSRHLEVGGFDGWCPRHDQEAS